MITLRAARRSAAALALLLALAACSGNDDGASETPSSATPTTSPSPLQDIVYSNPRPPFTVAYPGNWLSTGKPTPTQPVAAGEGTGQNMNVSLEKLPNPAPTLEEYAANAEVQLGELGLSIDETGTATLGGEPAATITSTSPEKQGVVLHQVFALHKGYAYVLTYGAPPTAFNQSVAQEIVDSFSFSR